MKKLYSWKSKAGQKDYLERLKKNNTESAIEYDKSKNFDLGDYIHHDKFGYGFILKVMNQTKVEVFFADVQRIMLQNWSNK
ncbi:hypothetical protein M899_1000 [Bacteriovorax sp. BSW11_IV]|nr:hypothetical protein M899_1000 [Bacteriovorax sp. BSW11_IV]